IAAAGMTRYGRTAEAMRVFAGLFESSLYFDQHRLPELFCGFPRRAAEGPTLYPVACSPQAWAAAAPFAMLQACLGLDIDAARAEVSLRTPRLPDFIQWVRVRHLAVGAHGLDLLLQRYENNGVGVEVMKKDGPVGIVVTV
ncbi:MAG TPA: amylo-alpha-1,6-glucosidase, partial [Burkholderiaceae bacterium]